MKEPERENNKVERLIAIVLMVLIIVLVTMFCLFGRTSCTAVQTESDVDKEEPMLTEEEEKKLDLRKIFVDKKENLPD